MPPKPVTSCHPVVHRGEKLGHGSYGVACEMKRKFGSFTMNPEAWKISEKVTSLEVELDAFQKAASSSVRSAAARMGWCITVETFDAPTS